MQGNVEWTYKKYHIKPKLADKQDFLLSKTIINSISIGKKEPPPPTTLKIWMSPYHSVKIYTIQIAKVAFILFNYRLRIIFKKSHFFYF